ncbi:MAG: AAA family ATPase [Spirochaetaceae bacterium]|nr:AAA family ATPase [Spirochaetaceae bacterium]
MDLFNQDKIGDSVPLASRMRPRNLDEYIGQEHIVGKGRLLRRAIAADQLSSVIFYGPPGTGKTTLARVIANHTKSNFITLNAVLTGVQHIRDAIAKAEEHRNLYNRKTILFVDEVHRWNKSQQDALLPWVENGTFILVGATTENPFFEVNKALVSRSRVFQLKPLTDDDLRKAAENAILDKERGYGRWSVKFEEGALEHLIETANGDARSLLNALELAVETTPEKWNPDVKNCEPPEGSEIFISRETAEESIQKKVVLYDKDGDYHYDIISAFIKSLRGRDPDAALYWLARMVAAGEDPHYIFRRMLISASEDTGLADPYALSVVESCARSFDRIGMPEGRYMLAQAALYLATCPKSNSSMAFFDALASVEAEDAEVPNHLKDANRDTESFGHGAGYLYPHAYRDHWVAQQYLPDSLTGRVFYTPGTQGYEGQIRQEVLSRRELQIAAILEETNGNSDEKMNPLLYWGEAEHLKHGEVKTGEQLTFSPGGKKRDEWQRRLDSGKAQALLDLRNFTVEFAQISRHSRNLVYGADDGLFLWELWRKSPEGFTAGICKTQEGKKILEQYAKTIDEIERPILATTIEEFTDVIFDYVFFRNPVSTKESFSDFVATITQLKMLYPKCTLIISQKIPAKAQCMASLLRGIYPQKSSLIDKIEKLEVEFFTKKSKIAWFLEDVIEILPKNENTKITALEKTFIEKRKISEAELARWFNPKSSYAQFLSENLEEKEFNEFFALLQKASSETIFDWNSVIGFIKID